MLACYFALATPAADPDVVTERASAGAFGRGATSARPSAATMRPRSSLASSSVSVRSVAPKATRKASERLPCADLLAPVLVEHDHLAQRRPGGLAHRRGERGGRHVLVDDEGEVLEHRRERDDVLVEDALRHRGEPGRARSSSNAAQPVATPGCTSPIQPCGSFAGLAGMQQRVRAALDLRLDLQRLEQRVDDALRVGVAALDDAGDAHSARPAAARPSAGRRARSRTARRPRCPPSGSARRRRARLGSSVVRRIDWSLESGSSSRSASRSGSSADEARRVRLREAAAGEHVLDRPPQLLLAREAADRLPARRQRERHVVEDEARDLLDEVGLARHVACAPGRHRHRVAVDVEPEPAEDAALLVGGYVEADAARSCARGPQLDDAAAPAARRARRSRPPSARRTSRR